MTKENIFFCFLNFMKGTGKRSWRLAEEKKGQRGGEVEGIKRRMTDAHHSLPHTPHARPARSLKSSPGSHSQIRDENKSGTGTSAYLVIRKCPTSSSEARSCDLCP